MYEHKVVREVIVFNGVAYWRYPNSKRLNDRNYFRPSSQYKKRGFSFLHREIWKSIHGEIPDGCDIHHKDENPLNNNCDNLECLTKSEHAKLHARNMPEWKRRWVAAQLDRYARPVAGRWHGSPDGIEWHRQHGIQVMQMHGFKTYHCEYCGEMFQSRTIDEVRFCSEKCRAAWRRAARLDDIEQPCEYCGELFMSNRYDKTRCCGNSCAAKLRWRKRKQS